MTAAEILSQAQDLIRNPQRWTQEAVARDKFGNEVLPTEERASRFDMVGAIQRIPAHADEYGAAIRSLRQACGAQSIFEFNDAHGHKAVVKAFGRAIEISKPKHVEAAQ